MSDRPRAAEEAAEAADQPSGAWHDDDSLGGDDAAPVLESNARCAARWRSVAAAVDLSVSPPWACATSEVERCLARECAVPVRLVCGDEEQTATLPLWLAVGLAKQAEDEHEHFDVQLDAGAAQQGGEGARTLALYSDRAMGTVRADARALSLGSLPCYYAAGAAVAVAEGSAAKIEAMAAALRTRMDRISVAATSMDSSSGAAFAQLLALPEKTFFEAVHCDAVALDDWRQQRPLRIEPSAYVAAAQDARAQHDAAAAAAEPPYKRQRRG